MTKLAAYRAAVDRVGNTLDERENAQMAAELAKYEPTTYSYYNNLVQMVNSLHEAGAKGHLK